ncbi:MAG: hypothetical protein QW331_03510 [Candidatus Woesearchaeota archaeon]
MTWQIEGDKTVNNEMISAIYQIKPPKTVLCYEEQKEIREKWGRILHEIDFPIQITARTLNSDLDKRIPLLVEKLSKEKKKNLAKFKMWVEEFVRKNCKPTRLYYITVSYKANIKKDKLRANVFLEQRQKKFEELLNNLNIKRNVIAELKLRNNYEKKIYDEYRQKKAMIGLHYYKKKKRFYHYGKIVKNPNQKIKEFLKEQTNPFLEKKESWQWKLLSSKELSNLWESFNNEGIFVNSEEKYWSIEELYEYWRKNT